MNQFYDRILDTKYRERDLLIQATGDRELAERTFRKRVADEWDEKIKNGMAK